jgi:hypothetical protein
MSEASYDLSVTSLANSRAISPTVVDSITPQVIISTPLTHTLPISPKSTSQILLTHPNNLTATQEVIEELIATCKQYATQSQ